MSQSRQNNKSKYSLKVSYTEYTYGYDNVSESVKDQRIRNK